jgi:uncharacterized protein YbcI
MSSVTDSDRPSRAAEDGPSILAAVSNEMVALFKQQFGRGPTRARASWSGEDTLTVVLEETLTPAERNMVRMGEHGRLRDTRTFLQYATLAEFCAPVERLTGRKVKAFLSAVDTEVDGMCAETFVLHPVGYDGPSRIDAPDGGPGRS